MSNERHIEQLQSLADPACVLIFTRGDAQATTSHEITDDEWLDIVDDFNKCYPDDLDWESFCDIVKRNTNGGTDR